MSTIVGISVNDAWKLAQWHKIIDSRKELSSDDKKMGIKKFAGALALQLISCASLFLSNSLQPIENISITMPSSVESQVSEVTNSTTNTSTNTIESLRSLKDANNNVHTLVKLPKKVTEKSKHKGSLSRKCKICDEKGVRHDVVYYCLECEMSHNYCSPDKFNQSRDCFAEHVRRMKRSLPQRKRKRDSR